MGAMNQPALYNSGYPAHRNPEGWAAFGAIAGVIIGGVAGGVLSLAFKPSEMVEAVAGDPDQAMAEADAQARALLEQWARWRRVSHTLGGIMATAGSGVGAYLGASPHQKRNAAIGALIGTGTMRLLNVIFNPTIGLPGLVAGGVGAYIGAKRADRRGAPLLAA